MKGKQNISSWELNSFAIYEDQRSKKKNESEVKGKKKDWIGVKLKAIRRVGNMNGESERWRILRKSNNKLREVFVFEL